MPKIVFILVLWWIPQLSATPECQRFLQSHGQLPFGWYEKARSFPAESRSAEALEWMYGKSLGDFRIRAFWFRDLARQTSADELRQIIALHRDFVTKIYAHDRRFCVNSYELNCCAWEDSCFARHTGFVSITDARGEIQMMLRLYYYDFELEYRFYDRAQVPAQILLPSERWTHLQKYPDHVFKAFFETPQPLIASHQELLTRLWQAQTREQRRALHDDLQVGEITRYSADAAFRRPPETTPQMLAAVKFLMQQRRISRVLLKSGKSDSSVHDRLFEQVFGFERLEEAESTTYFKLDFNILLK